MALSNTFGGFQQIWPSIHAVRRLVTTGYWTDSGGRLALGLEPRDSVLHVPAAYPSGDLHDQRNREHRCATGHEHPSDRATGLVQFIGPSGWAIEAIDAERPWGYERQVANVALCRIPQAIAGKGS